MAGSLAQAEQLAAGGAGARAGPGCRSAASALHHEHLRAAPGEAGSSPTQTLSEHLLRARPHARPRAAYGDAKRRQQRIHTGRRGPRRLEPWRVRAGWGGAAEPRAGRTMLTATRQRPQMGWGPSACVDTGDERRRRPEPVRWEDAGEQSGGGSTRERSGHEARRWT